MARQAGRPAQLGADDVIRFSDTDHFLRELAGNLGRGRAFVRTRRTFELQEGLAVRIEAPGVGWTVDAEAVVVFSRDGFVGLEFENFEQSVLPELDRLGQAAERSRFAVPSEATVIAPMPVFESASHRTGVAEIHITDEEPASGKIHMRPMPSIPDPAETDADEPPARQAADRSTTVVEDPPEESEDLPDGTQDLNLYDRPMRTRRPRNTSRIPGSPPATEDADDTYDGDPIDLDLLSMEPRPLSDAALESVDLEHEFEPWAPSPSLVVPRIVSSVEEVDPAVPDQAVPPDPPPPSGVAAEGIEIFEDRSRRFVRVTRGGVVKLHDEADLLGLYLSQARHGLLIAVGGPDGEVGARVQLKIAAGRAINIEAQILARVGGLVALAIPDHAPLRELLIESKDELVKALEGIVGEIAPQARADSAPPAPAAVVTSDLVEPVPEPAAPVVDASPPQPPKLIGTVVRFERITDLSHELKTNLSNGGLFVESSPLPLRSKKHLQLTVGDTDLGCMLEAEVVFADAGRVGFMLPHVQDVIAKLQQITETGEIPAPEDDDASIDLDQHALDAAAKAGDASGSLSPIKGKLDAPLTMGRILDLQFRRIDNETELGETSVLQLFEFLARRALRGVLDVEAEDKRKLCVWLHEGSVAFVTLKPGDENHALGRILINNKRLNEAGLRQGLETAQKNKKSLGRTLVSLGLIRKSDLSAGLREQTRVVLSSAFGFKGGRFEWGPWREPPGAADLVLTKGITVLAHHVRHRYEALGSNELEVLFGKNMTRRVAPVDDLDRIAGPMQLQQKELRFLQLQLDGTRPISDAVLGSPIGRLASLRLVGVLLSMGQLKFTDGHQHVVRENTSMAREPSAFVRVKKEMRERLALLRGMNHFEVLGVHWSAHHRSHRGAYDTIKREFDLKRAPIRDAPDDVKSIAKEINAIIDAAWQVLSNADTRQSYRKQMFDKTERQYAADMLVKQGEVALMRGDRVAAIEALETAVELEPSNRNRTLLATAREGRR